MCHAFLTDARFYEALRELDRQIATEVQAGGCPCGGVLHRADYPRKPRGFRAALSEGDAQRLSFCCARDGCRRRCTPPSVRFLGRKVYFGVIVLLATALQHGLKPQRRAWLSERLELSAQTLWRWRQWWGGPFAASPLWQSLRGRLLPPVDARALPGALLGRLQGEGLGQRVCRLLWLLAPLTTGSWTGSLRGGGDPQKM